MTDLRKEPKGAEEKENFLGAEYMMLVWKVESEKERRLFFVWHLGQRAGDRACQLLADPVRVVAAVRWLE